MNDIPDAPTLLEPPLPLTLPASEPINEPTPTPPVTPSKSSKKVRDLASGVFKKFGFAKGPGRPKKCRECDGATGGCAACDFTGFEPGKLDAGNVQTETRSEKPAIANLGVSPMAPAPLGDSVRAAAFRRAVGAAVKGVVKLLTSLVRVRATQAGLEKDFINAAIEEGAPKPEQVNDFTESLGAVLKKHNIEPEHCEEWTLAIDGLNLFSGFPAMFAMFREEIERKKQKEKST